MSDEGSDNEELPAGIDGKQAIKETLFDDDDDAGEDVSATPAHEREAEDRNEFGDLDEEEESGVCVCMCVCVCGVCVCGICSVCVCGVVFVCVCVVVYVW